jgi:hypothetical protein
MIFTSDDMFDFIDTNRLCLKAFLRPFDKYSKEQKDKPEIRLYRVVWQEWTCEWIDLAATTRGSDWAVFRGSNTGVFEGLNCDKF